MNKQIYQEMAKVLPFDDVLNNMVSDAVKSMKSFSKVEVRTDLVKRIIKVELPKDTSDLISKMLRREKLVWKDNTKIQSDIDRLASSYIFRDANCVTLDTGMYDIIDTIKSSETDVKIKRSFSLTRNYFLRSILHYTVDDSILSILSAINFITGYDILRIYDAAPYDLYVTIYDHKEEIFCTRGAGDTVLVNLTYILKMIVDAIVRNYGGKNKIRNMGNFYETIKVKNGTLYCRYYFDQLERIEFISKYYKL